MERVFKNYFICFGYLRIVIISVAIALGITAEVHAELVTNKSITISPLISYEMSGKNDIQLMRSYFQGASWESQIPLETWQRLQPLGISKLRLINVESDDSVRINAATSNAEFNFDSLLPSLQDCRKYNLVPHIVVGQKPQASLMISEDGKKYGVRDWELYEQYAYSFIEFVMIRQGFLHADFEVGNEPDINGVAWLLPERHPNGSAEMYQAYWQLYFAWAHAADRLTGKYPKLKLRLGGPDITPFTFAFGGFNWGKRFIGDIATQKVRMDFFSFHSYGNNASLDGQASWGTYPSFAEQVKYFRSSLEMSGLGQLPIYVTEWGPSDNVTDTPQGIINGNHVGAAWTAKFVREMASNKIDEGLSLILRDHTHTNSHEDNWAWPGFLLSDGVTPKALYNVALMFMKLPDRRVVASAPPGSIEAIAGADSRKLGVIVYNYNWSYSESRESSVTERVNLRVDELPFKAKHVRVIRYLVDDAHGDAYSMYKRGMSISQKNAELEPVEDVLLTVRSRGIVVENIIVDPSSIMLVEIIPAD